MEQLVQIESQQLLKLDQIHDETASIVYGSGPNEVLTTGGNTVYVGGKNFIAGVPESYQCIWRHTADDNQVTQVESAPVAAMTSNTIACTAPDWPHPPAMHEYVAELSVTQFGNPLAYVGDHPTTSFLNQAPGMTDLSGGIMVSKSAVSNGLVEFMIQVSDPDNEDDHVIVTGSAANRSFVRDITASSGGVNRTVTVRIGTSCGTTDMTLTVADRIGNVTTQTFTFAVQCEAVFVPIIRTRDMRSDQGNGFQPGMQNLQTKADTGSNFGAFTSINTITGATYIKITKLTGRMANEYAIFQFVSPLTSSVRQTILGCGVTNSYTSGPSTTRWTSNYSGRKVAGSLRMYNRYNNLQTLRYMFLCGINTSSDDDHSVLAFTYYTGSSNDWSDSWRGPYQRGTLWSMYNDDYKNGRGWTSLQGWPGYKAGSYNAGSYEVSITTDSSL